MPKYIILVLGLVALLASSALPQEVVISDFPLGVGGSVSEDVFKPYHDQLRAIAETLQEYPLLRAVIMGGADGERFKQSHDAKNPSLALGRAHALLAYMMSEFGVDSSQIIIRTEDVRHKGAQYRYASIRVVKDLSDMDTQLTGLRTRLDTLENRPPLEKHFTEIREVPSDPIESLGLQFGLGLSSSPFGAIPIATAAVTWKGIVYIEGIAGHTFWNGEFSFEGFDLKTKRRLIGGHAIYYPFDNLPLGIVGGWLRVEEVSQEYYEYTRLSEGLMLGARMSPLEFLSVTALYNPSRERVATEARSDARNGQFMFYATAHIGFGGQK